MRGRPHIVSRLVVALALLAFVLAAAAHRPAMTRMAPVDADLAAFLAMGGSLDALCLDGETSKAAPHPGCPACILAKALLAPPPPVTLAERRARPATGRIFAAVERVTPHTPRAPPGRGPPALA